MEHNYLVHHGINGQKWGQRNGPPYPLNASDYSALEKRLAKDTNTKNKLESKISKNEIKINKKEEKSEKYSRRSDTYKIRSAQAFGRDRHSAKAVRYEGKALILEEKIAKIKLKNLKNSKQAEELAKEIADINKDLKLSDLASSADGILKEKGYQ